MIVADSVITIERAAIFDSAFLEDGRYVIVSAGLVDVPSNIFKDGIAEMPMLLVSNSILAIRQYPTDYVVDLENLPDSLEFLYENGNVLFFVIKGDCDIPLIKA